MFDPFEQKQKQLLEEMLKGLDKPTESNEEADEDENEAESEAEEQENPAMRFKITLPPHVIYVSEDGRVFEDYGNQLYIDENSQLYLDKNGKPQHKSYANIFTSFRDFSTPVKVSRQAPEDAVSPPDDVSSENLPVEVSGEDTPDPAVPSANNCVTRVQDPLTEPDPGSESESAPPSESPATLEDPSGTEEISRLAARYRSLGLTREETKVLVLDQVGAHLPDAVIDRHIEQVFSRVLVVPDCTQRGLAQYCADQFSRSRVYCPNTLRFVHWDKNRWEFDTKDHHHTRKEIYSRISEILPSIGAGKERGKFDQLIGSASTLTGTAKFLEISLPEVLLEDFDRNPNILGVKNGTIDLTTQTLRMPKREEYISKLANVEYHSDSQCPQFEAFLYKIMCGDTALIRFLQIMFGYCLTGNNPKRLVAILIGQGGNGKSILMRNIQRIFGDYAASIPHNTLLKGKKSGVGDDIMSLLGHRLLTTSEYDKTEKLAAAMIKALSGNDYSSFRHLFKRYQTRMPEGKIFIITNGLPQIDDRTDVALFDRLRFIPFNYRFSDDEIDRNIDDILWGERSGILNWMLEGLRMYNEEGLKETQAMMFEKTKYREQADPLETFMKAFYEVSATGKTKAVDLLNHFNQWAVDQHKGIRLSDTKLKESLMAMNYVWMSSDTSYYNVVPKMTQDALVASESHPG